MSIGVGIQDSSQPLWSSAAVPYILSTIDAIVILFSSLSGGIGYQWAIGNFYPDVVPYCAVGLIASFIYILRMSGGPHYDLPNSAEPHVEMGEICVCWFTTGLLLAFFAFMLKIGEEYSRGAFVIFYFVAPVGLLGVRKLAKPFLKRAIAEGALGRRDVLAIVDSYEISDLGPRDLLSFFGAAQINHFILSRDENLIERNSNDLAILNSVANFVRTNDCREVLLAIPWEDSDRMERIRDFLKTLPVAVRLLPDMRVRSLLNHASSGRQPVPALEIQRAPLSASERLIKHVMDVVLASTALLFFLPLLVLTAIAIKLDGPGPVIFRQHRRGFNGKQFTMFKFRTMRVQENADFVNQAIPGDPRVTAIGRLLRSSSIDELPQLWNVLKRDMSLIGPRPHALAHDSHFEKLVGDYAYRHHVKPGITGWAQCNGARGATPTIEDISSRVKLDLWYINNWSLWLDIQILLKTFVEVLRKRNAY